MVESILEIILTVYILLGAFTVLIGLSTLVGFLYGATVIIARKTINAFSYHKEDEE